MMVTPQGWHWTHWDSCWGSGRPHDYQFLSLFELRIISKKDLGAWCSGDRNTSLTVGKGVWRLWHRHKGWMSGLELHWNKLLPQTVGLFCSAYHTVERAQEASSAGKGSSSQTQQSDQLPWFPIEGKEEAMGREAWSISPWVSLYIEKGRMGNKYPHPGYPQRALLSTQPQEEVLQWEAYWPRNWHKAS